MQGLEGVKVLELGHMVPAAYAAKLMADLGADVIKVEEPEGDRCDTNEEWQALCQAIEQPQLATDVRFRTARDHKAHEVDVLW